MQTPPNLPPNSVQDHLWHLESALWTSGRDSAQSVTAAGSIVILPYPDGILQGSDVGTRPHSNTGWRMVEMIDRTFNRRGEVAILSYRVNAEKADSTIHHALCASTWLNDAGTWTRLSHEELPVQGQPEHRRRQIEKEAR